jgi:hypothetical protein
MREADSRKGNPVAFLHTRFHENERGPPDACVRNYEFFYLYFLFFLLFSHI